MGKDFLDEIKAKQVFLKEKYERTISVNKAPLLLSFYEHIQKYFGFDVVRAKAIVDSIMGFEKAAENNAIESLYDFTHKKEREEEITPKAPREELINKKAYLRNAFETSGNESPFESRSQFTLECIRKVQEFYKFDYDKAHAFVQSALGIDRYIQENVVETLFEFVQSREKESKMDIAKKLYFIREHHKQSSIQEHNLAYSVYNKLLSDSFGYDYYKSRDIVKAVLGDDECNESGCIELIYHYIKKRA